MEKQNQKQSTLAIQPELRELIDEHLESTGFLCSALEQSMQVELVDWKREVVVNEIKAAHERNIKIRELIGWS